MEERNTIGITAVLTADTQLDGRIGLTAFFYGHANQLTNTFAIQCLEWVDWQDLHVFLQTWNFQTFDVLEQEFTFGIVAAIAKGGLSQVIGTEAEELGNWSNLIGGQGCTREFDHGAELVVDLASCFLRNVCCNRFKLAANLLQFVDMANERDHDLGMWVLALCDQFSGRFENRTGLHNINFGEEQA